jgi:pyroglutamyl-peptidase
MKKVLITGFDPFGGEKINPAYEAVKLLPDEIGGAKIIKKEIPTVFQKGPDAVYEAIQEVLRFHLYSLEQIHLRHQR